MRGRLILGGALYAGPPYIRSRLICGATLYTEPPYVRSRLIFGTTWYSSIYDILNFLVAFRCFLSLTTLSLQNKHLNKSDRSPSSGESAGRRLLSWTQREELYLNTGQLASLLLLYTRLGCFFFPGDLPCKRSPFYLKAQDVPRSKHLPPRLKRPVILGCTGESSMFFLRHVHKILWEECRIFECLY